MSFKSKLASLLLLEMLLEWCKGQGYSESHKGLSSFSFNLPFSSDISASSVVCQIFVFLSKWAMGLVWLVMSAGRSAAQGELREQARECAILLAAEE